MGRTGRSRRPHGHAPGGDPAHRGHVHPVGRQHRRHQDVAGGVSAPVDGLLPVSAGRRLRGRLGPRGRPQPVADAGRVAEDAGGEFPSGDTGRCPQRRHGADDGGHGGDPAVDLSPLGRGPVAAVDGRGTSDRSPCRRHAGGVLGRRLGVGPGAGGGHPVDHRRRQRHRPWRRHAAGLPPGVERPGPARHGQHPARGMAACDVPALPAGRRPDVRNH